LVESVGCNANKIAAPDWGLLKNKNGKSTHAGKKA